MEGTVERRKDKRGLSNEGKTYRRGEGRRKMEVKREGRKEEKRRR